MFDVFSKSVKDRERVARRHASLTRGDGVPPAERAGEPQSSCDRTYREQESTSGPKNRQADAELESNCS
ncbi:hypothetical protein [Microcoleus sp. BROC3]|uniref:hypothetical protein n=1 Tax=Microcoleus sp. BROC3 TaxID=3055323 RepID=UPI002FD07688